MLRGCAVQLMFADDVDNSAVPFVPKVPFVITLVTRHSDAVLT